MARPLLPSHPRRRNLGLAGGTNAGILATGAEIIVGWTAEPFVVPEAAYEAWDARARGEQLQTEWHARFAAYRAAHPALADEIGTVREIVTRLLRRFERGAGAAMAPGSGNATPHASSQRPKDTAASSL